MREKDAGYIGFPEKLNRSPLDSMEHAPALRDELDGDESAKSASGSEESSSDEELDTAPVDATTQRTSSLESAALSQPTSTAAWLELVEHLTSSSATLEAKAQLALSVLERAFKTNLANKRNAMLRKVMLACGGVVWPQTRVETEWESALQTTKSQDIGQRLGLLSDYMTYKLAMEGVDGIHDAMATIRTDLRRLPNSLEVNRLQLRIMWRAALGLSELGKKNCRVAFMHSDMLF